MPGARLYQGDFSLGLAEDLKKNKYDAIIATYSIHHLTDPQKVCLIESLLPLLNEGGSIYIGDVAFATRAELEVCMEQTGAGWDEDEIYPVFDELKKSFSKMEFEQLSCCAGLLTLK